MLQRTFSAGRTKENFSKVVRFYDFWGGLTESKAIDRAMSISGLSDNLKILDAGVGTGQLFSRIIEKNKSGLNYGLDLSPGMINRAKEKFKSIYTKHLLSLGNIFYLPYKNESFDYIFSSYVFDLLPADSFHIVLDELSRVMKANGTGIVLTMSMGEKWYNKFWYLLAKYFPSLLTNCRPVALNEYLEASGFKIIEKEIISQNTFPSEIIKFTR